MPETKSTVSLSLEQLNLMKPDQKLPSNSTKPSVQNNLQHYEANQSIIHQKLSTLNTKIHCYGPLMSLEPLVPKSWWKTLFADEMYLKTDGDVVEDPSITAAEVDQLLSDPHILSILENDGVMVLDLCCGQGRHTLSLAQKYPRVKFHGHDQSDYLIDLAQKRNTHKNARFTVGDCREIPAEKQFDLVLLMGNSFGYFENDEGDVRVLEEIQRVLKVGGVLCVDLTDGEFMRGFDERSWEWIDKTTFTCRQRELSEDGHRLVSREIICDIAKGVLRDQFYQERLYNRSEMNSLLQSSGFQQYGNQDEVVLAGRKSARGEDLGMMSQRMLIKAKLTARSSPLTSTTTPLEQLNEKKSLPFESLCVLMGDTSQPCPGKLNNKWNPEDLTTRQKLMDALSEIGYTPLNLTVLSTHTSMLPDLMKLSGSKSMVFNVCDEGFNNNASRELHIPAFMEMIDVRYTGAGPVCLGVCFDKGLTSQTAKSLGIHVPKEVFCSVNDTDQDIEYPVFVKPVKGDNSIGITERSLCRDQNELEKYFIELKAQGMDSLILQEFLSGTEYSVGVLGNKGYYTFLPIVEVDYQKILDQNRVPLLGYESKWDPTSVYWTDIAFKRANLDETKRTYLEEACVKLFERFECRDYARFDFRCDAHGRMKLLEVNPNPGWCWDGKFSFMAGLDGWSYSDIIRMILNAASKRLLTTTA